MLQHPRCPLKITLSNTGDTFSVLRGQIKLRRSPKWTNIRISPDRTPLQREFTRFSIAR